MRILLARLAGLFRRRRRDRDLDDEVRFHLETMAEEFRRRGLDAGEARLAALRQFGGVTQMKEAYRDQRGLPAVEGIVHDLQYGVRMLWRSPGFTLAALLTLALGIGANTAIFSVVNAVLLRPLPYPEPERLAHFVWRHGAYESSSHTGAAYLYFRERLRSVEGLAAFTGAGSFNLVNGGGAEFIGAIYVSREYFDVFGLHPAIGRAFTEEEDRPGGPEVMILTHGVWQRLFNGDPSVLGRTVSLGDRPVRVIGVMPASFSEHNDTDAMLPLKPSTSGRGSGSNYTVAARLAPGVTIAQASAEAAAVYATLVAERGAQMAQLWERFGFVALQESLARPVKPALLMMLGAVGLLLVIACANTASLLLARASGRGREIAVRTALGATRARIVRQLLTESLLLALAGAAVGLLMAYWAMPALLALTPRGYLITDDVRIDGTVLAATMVLAAVTGLLFGLAPALALSKDNLAAAFKDDGGRTATSRSGTFRRILVAGEIALCMLLLVGAGLLIKTFVRLRAVDPGFDPTGVLTGRMSLQGERYSNPRSLNLFYEAGLDRIRSLPGVRAAAVVNGLPIERALNLNVDVLDGPVHVENALTDWRYATSDYFETMGIPIVAGRGFTPADRAGMPPVAVVSEEFARRFLKNVNPLGLHIRVFDADGALEIVGIAKDLREGGLKTRPIPVMYVAVAQTHEAALRTSHGYFQVSWVVRADNPGPALARQIAEQVRAVDPQQPFSLFRTMAEVKSRAMATERFQMTLLATFAAIGLLLAAAGIFGLLAFSVAQRTREFGIRVALGASRARILRAVVGTAAGLAVIGIAVGTVAALATMRTLRSFVWDVDVLDPTTYLAVAVLLLAVALCASAVPALRAIRLDPVSALRE